jgi:hypothetical protein
LLVSGRFGSSHFEILLIEATEDYYMLPDDRIVGKHALFSWLNPGLTRRADLAVRS